MYSCSSCLKIWCGRLHLNYLWTYFDLMLWNSLWRNEFYIWKEHFDECAKYPVPLYSGVWTTHPTWSGRSVSRSLPDFSLFRDRSSFMGGGGRGWWNLGSTVEKSHDPPQLTNFFQMPLPLTIVLSFSDDLPPLQKNNPFSRFKHFNILYYSLTSRHCAHYEDNIYNSYTTESWLL